METREPQAFGDLLRRFRAAAGLTQEELAERSHLSARAISDLERGAKARPHRDTLDLLAAALQMAPPEHALFVAAARGRAAPATTPPVLAGALPAQRVAARPSATLPAPLTPFIGREREVAAVRQRLLDSHTRLLTLLGPGGTGKTRLALQVAGTLLDAFPDGVSFVPLAALTDAGLVVPTIAQVIGVGEAGTQPLLDSLKEHVRDQHLLLVLDNFEQVMDAAPAIAAILAAARDSRCWSPAGQHCTWPGSVSSKCHRLARPISPASPAPSRWRGTRRCGSSSHGPRT